MAPRNAVLFLVDEMPKAGAPAGAIQIRRGWNDDNRHLIMGMMYGCPCGCGDSSWMNFEAYGFKDCWGPQPKEGDDLTKMTLAPSIGFRRLPEGGYHWHGYLRDGVFEEC